jgi:hypothetical protein
MIQLLIKQQLERDQAHATIIDLVKKINAIPICFESLYSPAAVQSHASSLRQEVQTVVVHHLPLLEAKKVLGLKNSPNPRKIQNASKKKYREISIKCEQQETLIHHANVTIKACVKDIHHFPISFDGAKTREDINEYCMRFSKKVTAFIDAYPGLDKAHDVLGCGKRWHKSVTSAFRMYERDLLSRAEKINFEHLRVDINSTLNSSSKVSRKHPFFAAKKNSAAIETHTGLHSKVS